MISLRDICTKQGFRKEENKQILVKEHQGAFDIFGTCYFCLPLQPSRESPKASPALCSNRQTKPERASDGVHSRLSQGKSILVKG